MGRFLLDHELTILKIWSLFSGIFGHNKCRMTPGDSLILGFELQHHVGELAGARLEYDKTWGHFMSEVNNLRSDGPHILLSHKN